MSNRFTSRLSDNEDFKREELIRKIEHAVENMTLSELEALSYDMFTKGYITDYYTPLTSPFAIDKWQIGGSVLLGIREKMLKYECPYKKQKTRSFLSDKS